MAAVMYLARPGLDWAMPGQLGPTVISSAAHRPTYAPATTPSITVLVKGMAALAAPALAACAGRGAGTGGRRRGGAPPSTLALRGGLRAQQQPRARRSSRPSKHPLTAWYTAAGGSTPAICTGPLMATG